MKPLRASNLGVALHCWEKSFGFGDRWQNAVVGTECSMTSKCDAMWTRNVHADTLNPGNGSHSMLGIGFCGP